MTETRAWLMVAPRYTEGRYVMRMLLVISIVASVGCGLPKDYVKQQTTATFHNASDVAAHVKAKCGDQADADTDCVQAKTKLAAVCASLDEMAKKVGGAGFDCAGWRELP